MYITALFLALRSRRSINLERKCSARHSTSPQATAWRTFQDRLRSELRLAQAATLEEANQVLGRFVEAYNQQFGVPAREAASDFRPLSKRLNWDRLFSLK